MINLPLSVQHFFEHLAKARTRNVLMQLDDRLLHDAGISRQLLNKGVSQWPWRDQTAEKHPAPATNYQSLAPAPDPATRKEIQSGDDFSKQISSDERAARQRAGTEYLYTQPARPALTTTEYNRAVKELQEMSDRELQDLGISRSGIKHAVRYGTDKPSTLAA